MVQLNNITSDMFCFFPVTVLEFNVETLSDAKRLIAFARKQRCFFLFFFFFPHPSYSIWSNWNKKTSVIVKVTRSCRVHINELQSSLMEPR